MAIPKNATTFVVMIVLTDLFREGRGKRVKGDKKNMPAKKIITGKVTSKKYKCTSCGHISQHSTNHYGEIYPPCRNCAWKHPLEFGQVHKCMEKPPKGWGKPEPWKRVKLGDIAEIKVIKKRRK